MKLDINGTHNYETPNSSNKEETLIKYPVKYDNNGTYIFDADNNMVVQIRGWGRLQYLENGENKQDFIGQFVADSINEKLEGKDL